MFAVFCVCLLFSVCVCCLCLCFLFSCNFFVAIFLCPVCVSLGSIDCSSCPLRVIYAIPRCITPPHSRFPTKWTFITLKRMFTDLASTLSRVGMCLHACYSSSFPSSQFPSRLIALVHSLTRVVCSSRAL